MGYLYAQYFRAWEGKLYDANNQEFVMRGVNSAQVLLFIYFFICSFETKMIIYIKMEWDYQTWDSSGKPYFMNYAFEKLESTIQEAIKWKLVPILELHDVTGFI